jgi:osmotically-inducible protein OsmY
VTTLGFTPAAPTATALTQVRSELRDTIARSSRLTSRDNIQLGMDGGTVVLRGTVVDDHERRLAESLVRLSPGVRDVRNELQVRGEPPQPRQ